VSGRTLIGLVLAAVLLAGCAAMGTGIDPSAGLPEVGGMATGDTPLYGESDRWWEAFGDEELNALIQEALGGNLGIAQAYERLRQAEALARESGASRYPWLGVGGTAERRRAADVTGSARVTTRYGASATARYEVDLWGRVSSQTRAAVLDAEATREQVEALRMTVSAEVAESYFTAIEQKGQVELSELTVSAFQDTRELVELRYAKGVATALEVYQARQNLANAAVPVPAFETAMEASLAELNLLMGRDPRTALDIAASALPPVPAFPDFIPADLLERRPDVQAALLAVRARDERVAAAVADRFPSFNLIGSYGGASDTLGQVLDSGNIIWSLLLDVALPVFEGGRRKAAAERTRAAFMESLAAYHEAVLTALREAHVALIRNQGTEERIRLLEEAVSSGRDTLRVAERQYLGGVSDYLNVLNAQQALYVSERSLLAARRQLVSDRIQIARALGGTWMGEERVALEPISK
jgi:NodT family efflux transporter outer membrane factor (OMF) lipoprotein